MNTLDTKLLTNRHQHKREHRFYHNSAVNKAPVHLMRVCGSHATTFKIKLVLVSPGNHKDKFNSKSKIKHT